MANPPNQMVAGRQAKSLLAKTLPGSRRGSVRAHLQRADHIARRIWQRWHVGPRQWQLKHVRWYLTTCSTSFSFSTAYRYWLTVRVLVYALGKHDDWMPQLQGRWIRSSGDKQPLKTGRPPKLPNP